MKTHIASPSADAAAPTSVARKPSRQLSSQSQMQCDQRQCDEVVLDEAREHHQEHRRLDGAALRVALPEPCKSGRHHREAEELRLVHPDIELEEARERRHKPETRDQRAGTRGSELANNAGRGRTKGERRQDRDRTPHVERIAEQPAKPAHHVVGERRIVVGDQPVARGIELGGAPHRSVGVIGVPALVTPDLHGKERAPDRPHQEQCGERSDRPDQDGLQPRGGRN